MYTLGSLKSVFKTLSLHTITWQKCMFWTSKD